MSRFCTDRPKRSSSWLTNFTMACPGKNRGVRPPAQVCHLPTQGHRKLLPSAAWHPAQQLQSEGQIPPPLPYPLPQTQVRWAAGGRAAGGTLGTLISTSLTAFTFSGASLNNSSKTSSADRSNKHLITMLLSLCQTGTSFPPKFLRRISPERDVILSQVNK